jgi:integrase
VIYKHGAYYFRDARDKWHHLGHDYIDAMLKYAEINSVGKSVFTMRAVFDRYIKTELPKKAPGTQRDNLQSFKFLRAAFGDMSPDDVTPQDVYAYMDARDAPVRANRDKALLSHVFKKAIRWGATTNNPCRDVESNPERPRDRYVNDIEFNAFYDFINSDLIRHTMRLTAMTGLRQNKLLALTRHNLTSDGIEIDSGKRGLKLLIQWTTDLRTLIDEILAAQRVSSIYLFCTREGAPYTTSGFKSIWQRAMNKAVTANIIGQRFTFHDLRAKAGSETTDHDLLGHKNKATFHRVYRRKPIPVTPVRSVMEKKKQ